MGSRRLATPSSLQSHLLGDLTEVPVPVRFIYFLLGPEDSELDYHEVGRAMATLMSDKVSRERERDRRARKKVLVTHVQSCMYMYDVSTCT